MTPTPPPSEQAMEKAKEKLSGAAYRQMSVLDRFEAHYEPEPNSGCWLWIGPMSKCRSAFYGCLGVNGKTQRAHRVAYELFVGPILDETLDHRCRTTVCVNPAHLRPMSTVNNIAEARVPAGAGGMIRRVMGRFAIFLRWATDLPWWIN